jgi:hypothetical protein
MDGRLVENQGGPAKLYDFMPSVQGSHSPGVGPRQPQVLPLWNKGRAGGGLLGVCAICVCDLLTFQFSAQGSPSSGAIAHSTRLSWPKVPKIWARHR